MENPTYDVSQVSTKYFSGQYGGAVVGNIEPYTEKQMDELRSAATERDGKPLKSSVRIVTKTVLDGVNFE